MPLFVNTWLWIFRFSQICQRLSTFVNAYFFMEVIDIMKHIGCQRCQLRNVCILFFEMCLIKKGHPQDDLFIFFDMMHLTILYGNS